MFLCMPRIMGRACLLFACVLPQSAQLRQLLQLVCGTTSGGGRKRAVDFEQREFIVGQMKRMLLIGQTEQVVGRSVQTPTDLADEI